jgi:hypothetical protein
MHKAAHMIALITWLPEDDTPGPESTSLACPALAWNGRGSGPDIEGLIIEEVTKMSSAQLPSQGRAAALRQKGNQIQEISARIANRALTGARPPQGVNHKRISNTQRHYPEMGTTARSATWST